jgi:hypothetical protein
VTETLSEMRGVVAEVTQHNTAETCVKRSNSETCVRSTRLLLFLAREVRRGDQVLGMPPLTILTVLTEIIIARVATQGTFTCAHSALGPRMEVEVTAREKM